MDFDQTRSDVDAGSDDMEADFEAGGAGWRHLEWWDSVSWGDILAMEVVTSSIYPQSLVQAITDAKVRVCQIVDDFEDAPEGMDTEIYRERPWKLLLAMDALFWGGIAGGELSRREQMTERLQAF